MVAAPVTLVRTVGRQQRLKRERERERAPRKRTERSGSFLSGTTGIILAGVVALVAVGGLIYAQQRPTAADTMAASPTPPNNVAMSGKAQGLDTAPVTIEEFADFQCPACKLFHDTIEPTLVSDLVASGKVRLVFREYAFLGNESVWAAQAAECANDQGKFWAYHDALYDRQGGENKGIFTKTNLKNIGRDLGLPPSFNTCVDSDKYAAAVRAETADGQSRGVKATPTLLVNGTKIEGVPNYADLKKLVEQLLQK